MTLSDAPVTAIVPVTNLAKSKEFYGGTLGLQEKESKGPGHVLYAAGRDTSLLIYERPPAPTEHTVAGFWVADLEGAMTELRAKGVAFEEYDLPGLKTENGIASQGPQRSAWFRDPDGHILALNAEAR